MTRRATATCCLSMVILAAASCTPPPSPQHSVVTSFYPLAFVAERLAGDIASVENLTPPGVEPHDLELTPDQLGSIQGADVLVSMGGGFQPAVDDAGAMSDALKVKALDGLDLDTVNGADGALDPHVWLDPVLMQQVVTQEEAGLSEAFPDRARVIHQRAEELRRQLRDLDDEFAHGLTGCERTQVITSHAAFSYLTNRYGLEQIPIAGVSPEADPDPARLAEIAQVAEASGATTIFTEELVSPRVAETLAREAGGIQVATLSPLEGLTPSERANGADYFSIMRDNLNALRTALDCTSGSR